MPGVVELREQEAAAVPLGDSLIGVDRQETVSPVDGFTVEVRLTLPAKLSLLAKPTDMAPLAAPELKSAGLLTETVKSPT